MSQPQTDSPPSGSSAGRAVLLTEGRLFLREPGAAFWIVAFPTLLLVILGLIPAFRKHDPDLGGQSVVDLYVPVCVILAMIMAGIQAMPTIITGYRERGVLRRLRATPVHPGSLLSTQAGLHGAGALVGAALVLVSGHVGFGTPLPEQLGGYLVALALTLLTCLAMGAVITAVSTTTKVATMVSTIVFFPSMFTSGVWLPVQTMPHVMQQIVLCTPLGAAARALNDAALGEWPRLLDLAVTAGWAAVLGLVAVRTFRWE